MARSFSNIKLVSALISDGSVSVALNRSTRCYSATTASSQVVVARSGGMMSKQQGGGGGGGGSEEKAGKPTWVPDPVTGYYRPENRTDEINVAELREVLLNNNNNNNNKTRQP